jgi:hypothetical protein
MTNTTTQDVQEQILSTIRKGQEVALDALKTWVETVQSVTSRIPSVDVPFADRLPKPHDVVASSYKFAEQVLSNQKKFADEVLEVTSPLLPGQEDSKSPSGK